MALDFNTQPRDRGAAEATTTSTFQNFFGRSPKQVGLNFFSDAIVNRAPGTETNQAFRDSVLAGASGADLDYFNNKQDNTVQPTTPTEPAMPPIQMFQPDKGPVSKSGLDDPYRATILDTLVPRLTESVTNYRTDIDDSTQAAKEMYASLAKGAMKEGTQGILNDLASRGILNSSVAGDAFAKGFSNISRDVADKGFQSAMMAAGMKADESNMLGNLINLGKYSESTNTLAPYDLMERIYSRQA